MPIYEYECQKCGRVFEVRQSFSDDPITVCEDGNCKGKVKKLFSPPAIIFKGSGFHVNDYGRGSNAGKPSPSSAEKAQEKAETCKACEGASCSAK